MANINVTVCQRPLAPGGPRTEKEIKEGSVLHQLGYTADMVAKM